MTEIPTFVFFFWAAFTVASVVLTIHSMAAMVRIRKAAADLWGDPIENPVLMEHDLTRWPTFAEVTIALGDNIQTFACVKGLWADRGTGEVITNPRTMEAIYRTVNLKLIEMGENGELDET